MDIMKVKPWGQGQGDYVLLNVSDFDPAFHVPMDAEEAAKVADKLPAEKAWSGLVAKHKGRGKFEVLDASGAVVHEGLTKEEAEAIVAAG